MSYNIFNIENYVGSNRVHSHWMYQDFVLLLVWWWLVVAETCYQVLNFTGLIHGLSVTVIKLLHSNFPQVIPFLGAQTKLW